MLHELCHHRNQLCCRENIDSRVECSNLGLWRKQDICITYLTTSPVHTFAHLSIHPFSTSLIPWSNITALSSLTWPSTWLEDKWWGKSSQQLEGSDTDVENREDALTSSLTTSILSVLNLHHPTTLPSDQLLTITTTNTDTSETVPDVPDLWVSGRGICLLRSLVRC